jgi:UDP-2,3-diacylglucosamine pyrophosphatase LpxH
MKEDWLKEGKAQSVVYGHTHRQVVVPLRATLDSTTTPQIYFNSGTWRPVHDLAVFQQNQQQFVGYHVMTYLAFFDGDEFNGRAFDSWSGTLDTE